jgi:hypothetical protein
VVVAERAALRLDDFRGVVEWTRSPPIAILKSARYPTKKQCALVGNSMK